MTFGKVKVKKKPREQNNNHESVKKMIINIFEQRVGKYVVELGYLLIFD